MPELGQFTGREGHTTGRAPHSAHRPPPSAGQPLVTSSGTQPTLLSSHWACQPARSASALPALHVEGLEPCRRASTAAAPPPPPPEYALKASVRRCTPSSEYGRRRRMAAILCRLPALLALCRLPALLCPCCCTCMAQTGTQRRFQLTSGAGTDGVHGLWLDCVWAHAHADGVLPQPALACCRGKLWLAEQARGFAVRGIVAEREALGAHAAQLHAPGWVHAWPGGGCC